MSLLDNLMDHDIWLEFLEYKKTKYLDNHKYLVLKEYIENKTYIKICSKIVKGEYQFSIPIKKEINKRSSNKKRAIYLFNYEENIILKFLTYLLFKEYPIFCHNCYSFKRGSSPKQAFLKLTKNNINSYYIYKVDISNYFNSIDISLMLNKLKEVVDLDTFNLLKQILLEDKVQYNGKIIQEQKGVMAGTPISCFLSNLYLKELDLKFETKLYARYADDIIILAPTKEELDKYIKIIYAYLKQYKLKVNSSKEQIYLPKAKWEFLGFSYHNGVIDISFNTKKKIKEKLRRKARALRRWCIKNHKEYYKGMVAFNRIFNYKFYGGKDTNELNWIKWYFPVINVDSSLKEIDKYYQDKLRYIKTGKYNKANYQKVPYEELKKTGYRSLVHEYYKFDK